MAESADYHIEGESETTLCVCGSKSQVHKFQIRPQTIGEVNLTVSAAGSNSDTACGEQPTEKVVARDAVTRPLIIEASAGHFSVCGLSKLERVHRKDMKRI